MAKILVADRAPSVRRVLMSGLSGDGHELLESGSSKATLEAARDELPDLILLDPMMAGAEGLELLGRLKEDPTTGAIPVIVLSESSNGESPALRLGAVNYIIKPWGAGVVEASVRVALRDSEPTKARRTPRTLDAVGRVDDLDESADATQPVERGRDSSAVKTEPTEDRASASTSGLASLIGDLDESGDIAERTRDFTAVRTGMTQLDQVMRGGIPIGSLSLVEGNPSAGKSVLCYHMTYESLLDGQGVAISLPRMPLRTSPLRWRP